MDSASIKRFQDDFLKKFSSLLSKMSARCTNMSHLEEIHRLTGSCLNFVGQLERAARILDGHHSATMSSPNLRTSCSCCYSSATYCSTCDESSDASSSTECSCDKCWQSSISSSSSFSSSRRSASTSTSDIKLPRGGPQRQG